MESHGFPWPPMLDCDKFPLDNDMCITSQSEKKKQKHIKENKSNEGSNIMLSEVHVEDNSNGK